MLVIAFTALPLFDVPGIGISITAPLVYFIAIELLLGRSRKGINVQGWTLCLVVIGLGIFASSIMTGLSDNENGFTGKDTIYLIRYSYWLLASFVSMKLISKKPQLGMSVVKVAVWATFILVLCRWFEGIVWGKVGAWSHTKILTENAYAFIFSTFGAMFISLTLISKGRKRLIYSALTAVLWGAIFINGSRSCWITTTFSLCAFVGMRYLVNPLNIKTYIKVATALTLIIIAGLASFYYLPDSAKESFISRFSTFEKLDTDKSYQIRVLMQTKAKKIFAQSPVWGCGPARFKRTKVYLEIPKVLSYGGQEKFMYRSSHNSYLQFLAETGIVGNVPYYIFLFLLLFKGFFASIRMARRKIDWPMGVYIGFLTMSLHMWSISALTNTHVWVMYGMVAITISIDHAMKKAERREGIVKRF